MLLISEKIKVSKILILVFRFSSFSTRSIQHFFYKCGIVTMLITLELINSVNELLMDLFHN